MAKLKAQSKYGILHALSEESVCEFAEEGFSDRFRMVLRTLALSQAELIGAKITIPRPTRILLPIGCINFGQSGPKLRAELAKKLIKTAYPQYFWRTKSIRRELISRSNNLCRMIEGKSEENCDNKFVEMNNYFKKDFLDFYVCLDVSNNTRVLINRIVFDRLAVAIAA